MSDNLWLEFGDEGRRKKFRGRKEKKNVIKGRDKRKDIGNCFHRLDKRSGDRQ